MKILTDTDPMPWGKHRGQMMQEVPASYLHWLWHRDTIAMRPIKIKNDPVFDYIFRNLSALRKEYTDGIWS